MVEVNLTVSKPEGLPHAQMDQQQSRLNYNRKTYIRHIRDIPGVPRVGDQGDCANGLHRMHNTKSYTNKTGSLTDIPNT